VRSIWYSGEAGVIRAEPVDLAQRHRRHGLGQLRVLEPLAQLGELGPLALAELLLDRLELLAQVVLPLRVAHLLLRLRLDLALQLEQRDLARQGGGHGVLQLLQQVVLLEQRLLVGRLHVDERRQHVRQPQRVVDVHDDARSSSDRPVASESAFSTSSWMRRTCASTSMVRSVRSGSP
jgi:hypothetical protein